MKLYGIFLLCYFVQTNSATWYYLLLEKKTLKEFLRSDSFMYPRGPGLEGKWATF